LTPAREIWLRRPTRPSTAHLLRRLGRNIAYLLGFILLAAGTTLLQQKLFHHANLMTTEMITCLLAVIVIWYVEFYLARRQREQRIAGLMMSLGNTLQGLSFSDGSTGDFKPAGVIRSTGRMLLAVDPAHLLLRVVALANQPQPQVDWIFALPDNIELDVASHSRTGRPAQAVPSLIFSDEQDAGFRVIAWPLAPDSVATAERLVAQIRSKRG
jgi:hypothetical protein